VEKGGDNSDRGLDVLLFARWPRQPHLIVENMTALADTQVWPAAPSPYPLKSVRAVWSLGPSVDGLMEDVRPYDLGYPLGQR
jgi:hypothetical protein